MNIARVIGYTLTLAIVLPLISAVPIAKMGWVTGSLLTLGLVGLAVLIVYLIGMGVTGRWDVWNA